MRRGLIDHRARPAPQELVQLLGGQVEWTRLILRDAKPLSYWSTSEMPLIKIQTAMANSKGT